jgi:Tfp pilus assembly protein PilF
MARVWELLDKAYLLINAGYPHQARAIINQILARDPQNIEAWEVYITTCSTTTDLESLKEAVELIWRSKVRGGDYLNAKRRYILRRINERISSM